MIENSEGKMCKARCKHCKAQLFANPSDGTKHLWNHLKNTHSSKSKNPIGQMMLACEQKSMDLKNFTFSQTVSRQALTKMILLHEYPFTLVEQRDFREFVGTLQPNFTNYIEK